MKTFAFLRENKFAGKDGGKYNGYVGIIDENSIPLSYQGFYNKNRHIADDAEAIGFLDDFINIHGGITWDGAWNAIIPIVPLTAIHNEWYKYRVIGFDTNHCEDNATDWNFDTCKVETFKLQQQIEELLKHKQE